MSARLRFSLFALLFVVVGITVPVTVQANEQAATETGWDEAWEDDWDEPEAMAWHGFFEMAAGSRWDEDPALGRNSILGELRWRLEAEHSIGRFDLSFKADAWRDEVLSSNESKLREAAIAFNLGSSIDVKLGRQVLTWGTGDLVFVNDLFPKDFSYFAGRDDEYLKAPSDALRFSHYSDLFNVDLVVMPRFAADEFFTGERFSFFLPGQAIPGVPDSPPILREPGSTEYAIRVYRRLAGAELALYGFHGFYKQPSARAASGELLFAPLSALGGSIRGALAGGVGYLEFAQYTSRDDRTGTDPSIINGQQRLLLGYERELATNFTANFQYYLERTRQHDDLLIYSPQPQFEPGRQRHLLSTRLTYRLQQDRWVWSLFAFYSPDERDYHLRPALNYRHNDRWQITSGINLFGGGSPATFLGQLENNSNLYLRVRMNY